MSDLIKLSKLPDGWIKDKDDPDKLKPSTLHNGLWIKALKNVGNKLRFNLVTLKPELNGIPFQPDDIDNFYCLLADKGYKISKEQCKDAVVFVARQNCYNPIEEELLRIENNNNIEPVDIDKLATEYLGTSSELDDAKLAACMIGAIARGLDHGCQMDYVLCLKGKQGLKKSEFWRTITGEEYFAETQQRDLKDLRMTMNCCWIYEYPEIEQLTSKKDVGAIKALITQRKDQFRPPFGSSVGTYPRKSILVGSLNEDEFLRDKTGNRRFWVIDLPYDPDLGEQLDIPKLKRDREKILKAAILAYRSGRLPMLTLEQEVQSKKQNLNYESEHPFQSAVEQTLRKWQNSKFSTKSILIDSELRTDATITQKDMNDVAAILRGLGYVRDKNQTTNSITKERSRLWSLAQPTHS